MPLALYRLQSFNVGEPCLLVACPKCKSAAYPNKAPIYPMVSDMVPRGQPLPKPEGGGGDGGGVGCTAI